MLHKLPPEVIGHIFSYLNSPEALRMALFCGNARFSKAITSSTTDCFLQWRHGLRCASWPQTLEFLPFLHSLTLKGAYDAVPPTFGLLTTLPPTLKVLKICLERPMAAFIKTSAPNEKNYKLAFSGHELQPLWPSGPTLIPLNVLTPNLHTLALDGFFKTPGMPVDQFFGNLPETLQTLELGPAFAHFPVVNYLPNTLTSLSISDSREYPLRNAKLPNSLRCLIYFRSGAIFGEDVHALPRSLTRLEFRGALKSISIVKVAGTAPGTSLWPPELKILLVPTRPFSIRPFSAFYRRVSRSCPPHRLLSRVQI